jgi:TolA-binding protein
MKKVLFVKGILTITLLLALVAVTGCGEKKKPQNKTEAVSTQDVKKDTKQAYDTTKAYTQEQIQAFRQQTETKLTEYEKDIDQLQSKAEKLRGDAKVKAEQQLTALRQKRDAVLKKLKELSSSSGNAWDQIKSGIDATMKDLEDTYKKAAAEFSKS